MSDIPTDAEKLAAIRADPNALILPENAYCRKHVRMCLEDKPGWEAQLVYFQILLLYGVMSDDRFIRLMGGIPELEVPGDIGDFKGTKTLAAIAPLCCWLDPVDLMFALGMMRAPIRPAEHCINAWRVHRATALRSPPSPTKE